MANNRSIASALESATGSVPKSANAKCPIPWWKRLTLLTFLFFLVKGLAWLVVPAIIILWRSVAD